MELGTIASHLDAATLDLIRSFAATENRSPSQILAVALKLMMELPPVARRALLAVDDATNDEELSFMAKHMGRAALKAYEDILDARTNDIGAHSESDQGRDIEEAIEAEAVRVCRL